MLKIFIAVLVAAVALIVVFQIIDPNAESIFDQFQNQITLNNGEYISNMDGKIYVTVSGEIVKPGTYIMEENQSLGELLSLAGGATTNADELAYDISYVLQDGYSFYIAPKYDNSDVCTLTPIEKVNINEDDETALTIVSGIGTTTAKAIVNYRTSSGNFARIEDLKLVSGIGTATFEKIKNYVVLRNE